MPLPPLHILPGSPIGLKVQCKVHRPDRSSVVYLLTPLLPWVLLCPLLSSAPDFTPSHLQHTLCASVTGHLELWSNLSSEMLLYHCLANIIHLASVEWTIWTPLCPSSCLLILLLKILWAPSRGRTGSFIFCIPGVEFALHIVCWMTV